MASRVIAGRFRPVRRLGQGAAGEVFEAEDLQSGGSVALKILLVRAGGPESAVPIRRFRREVESVRRVAGPHVATVIAADIDEVTQRPFIAMELLRGADLQSVMKGEPLPLDLALAIGWQVAAGLAEAHGAGVVHRDVKPSNLFIARQVGGYALKILDFGVAKVATGGETNLTTDTNTLLGTPRYMAPEQFQAASDVGPAADVWSLGVVLFRLLTGKPPHPDDKGIAPLVMAICSDPAPDVRALAPDVPEPVATFLRRCLALEPEARHRDGAVLMGSLEDLGAPRELPAALLDGLLPRAAEGVKIHALGASAPRPAKAGPESRTEVRPPSFVKDAAPAPSLAPESLTTVYQSKGPDVAVAVPLAPGAEEEDDDVATVTAPGSDAVTVTAPATPAALEPEPLTRKLPPPIDEREPATKTVTSPLAPVLATAPPVTSVAVEPLPAEARDRQLARQRGRARRRVLIQAVWVVVLVMTVLVLVLAIAVIATRR